MAGRTGHRGIGHIRKLPSGRYQASYVGPDLNRHNGPVTFKTKMDAEGWLNAEHRLIERQEWRSPAARATAAQEQGAAQALTVNLYAEQWLTTRSRTANHGRGLAPRTAAEYRRYLDRHILPALGALRLQDVTRQTIEAWAIQLDPTTQRQNAHVYTLLKSIFATAAENDIIEKSPFRTSDRIATPKRKIGEPATLDELATITLALPERLRLMVELAAWCALRFGEVAELRRSDINTEKGVINVSRAVQWVEGNKIVKAPKADSGRVVAYPPHLRPVIEEHLAQHAQGGTKGLLFPTLNGGQYRPETFTKSFWRDARHAAGRDDLRFHDLRHTGATLAAASGATLAELMSRLGHSTVTAALAYQHAAQVSDARIAAQLSEIATKHQQAERD